ncbi:MAG TPA: hypothetical protein VGX21_13200 [Methylomirabilota bacterium]|jgi:hypothetical protein|nr:hypothetical protein [Methylomirabilota bacterium]
MSGAELPPPGPVTGPVPIGEHFVAVYQQVGGQSSAQLQCRPCGQTCSLVNPTAKRMRSFVNWHRCGPLGSRWQDGPDVVESTGTEPLAEHAVSLGWLGDLVEAEAQETYFDERVYATAQRVAHALEKKLRGAEAGRLERLAADRPAHFARGGR